MAESEMGAMREQLLANANLLASPNFSRAGSMRGDARGTVGKGKYHAGYVVESRSRCMVGSGASVDGYFRMSEVSGWARDRVTALLSE